MVSLERATDHARGGSRVVLLRAVCMYLCGMYRQAGYQLRVLVAMVVLV